MSDKTLKNARKPPATAWKPGQSGNPKGRPQGSRNKATLAAQAMIDGKADALVKKAIELALAGDGPVLRAMLDRLCPPRKDGPVRVDLPAMECAADLPGAIGAILAACASGELTPSEAASLAALVETHRRALETSELSNRIAKLEERNGL
jgi:hypothetical protein